MSAWQQYRLTGRAALDRREHRERKTLKTLATRRHWQDTGHALSTGTNRQPGLPASALDDFASATADVSDYLSFPILSAWPVLSCGQSFRVVAERPAIGLRVGGNGGVLRLADL